MAVAGKMFWIRLCSVQYRILTNPYHYKEFNTPARLGELTNSKLVSLGVSDSDDRKLCYLRSMPPAFARSPSQMQSSKRPGSATQQIPR